MFWLNIEVSRENDVLKKLNRYIRQGQEYILT
jgi:hypothetical protein